MIIGGLDTSAAAAQLRLLFDIKAIFKRRGRRVASFENPNELLFDPTPYDAFQKYYPLFHSSSFRRVLGFAVNSQQQVTVDKICSEFDDLSKEKIQEVLDRAVEFQILFTQDDKYWPQRSVGFGPTFEWYVAGVCLNELASIAYWGVKVEKLTGDYDVVLIRENQVGYIECKSGKLENIKRNEITNFFLRERILAPQFSIYLVDGVSRENIEKLVNFALEEKFAYRFEIPGVMDTDVTLEAEYYKNFVRLVPINSFFVSLRTSLTEALREIYEFLTLVFDRSLPTENMAAKVNFRR